MNLERMEILADVLAGVAAKKRPFSVEWWGGLLVPGRPECGTACCAGGYAALDSRLMAQGLQLVAGRGVMRHAIDDSGDLAASLGQKGMERSASVAYDGSEEFFALKKFFGLTFIESEWIFSPQHYTGWNRSDPRCALGRVQAMIKLERAETQVRGRPWLKILADLFATDRRGLKSPSIWQGPT
jgi:hypothetical protein